MEQQCVIEPRNYGSKYMLCFEINMSTATLKMDFIIGFFLLFSGILISFL